MDGVGSRPLDLDLRVIRYFVAVADHAHFGRAASALHIGQPSLSRQIRGLERQVGAQLFDRTPRGTSLSAAGVAFLPHARALLQTADDAAAAARATIPPGGVTIGYTSGIVITAATRELRRRCPDAHVRTVYLGWRRPAEALVNHDVDAVVARLPFPAQGLRITHLYEEGRVVVMPRDHPLAGRTSVDLDDIADEPLPRVRDLDPVAAAFWRLEPRPDGHTVPDGPVMDSLDDAWEFVASGDTLSVATAQHVGAHRPDLAMVPLRGITPSTVVLATRAGDDHAFVAELRRCAVEHLTGETFPSGV